MYYMYIHAELEITSSNLAIFRTFWLFVWTKLHVHSSNLTCTAKVKSSNGLVGYFYITISHKWAQCCFSGQNSQLAGQILF